MTPFSAKLSFTMWLLLCFCISSESLIVPEKVDFGVVFTGEKASFTIRIENNGEGERVIEKAKPTCSCTLVPFSKSTLAPHEHLEINGELDTFGRLGKIKKSIRVYVEGRPTPFYVRIEGFAKAFPKNHLPTEGKSLFKGECRVCHVRQGEGRFAQYLYLADCALCHGIFKNGGKGGAHSLLNLSKMSDDEMMKIIAEGKDEMPAFSKEHGGPLSPQQLHSLLAPLRKPATKRATLGSITGSQLYYDLCSACHGTRRTGPIGSSLANLTPDSYDALYTTLSTEVEGTLSHAFLKEKGGILSEDEIKLILNYLTGKKPSRRK